MSIILSLFLLFSFTILAEAPHTAPALISNNTGAALAMPSMLMPPLPLRAPAQLDIPPGPPADDAAYPSVSDEKIPVRYDTISYTHTMLENSASGCSLLAGASYAQLELMFALLFLALLKIKKALSV